MVAAVVVIVRATSTGVLPAGMVDGEKVQVVFAGNPEQLKLVAEAVAGFGAKVKCSVADWPAVTVTEVSVGLNVKLSGAATARVEVAMLPVPPFVDVTLPVVLEKLPAAAPVTVTLNWHWPLAAIVAPLRAMPVGAVVVTVPPQAVVVPSATVKPVGNASVKATPVSAAVFAAGFVMVKVSAEVPLKAKLRYPFKSA